MFQLSSTVLNLCHQPKSSLTNRPLDVASTHQHLAQNFNRPLLQHLRGSVIYVLKSVVLLGSHRLVVIIEVRRLAT